MRIELIRAEVQRLIRDQPFRAFSLNLENGDRLIIEHPENIAFDPVYSSSTGEHDGSQDFYVLSSSLRTFSTFDAVSSVTLLDEGSLSAN